MINLEPIAKSVQKRLFEKMRALGRETSYSDSPTGVLTQQEMMSRTTFIKMGSNQKRPVILMGGELKEDGGLRAGYDEIYGSRGNNENPNKRPMPGIKSIDVSFKGGARSSREATINWTCWSFEDITRLTPHFLAHGKTVLLEWGWVYNKKSLIDLPTFFELDGKTKRSAYKDYTSEILKGKGDFDMMVGVVKNFEYTTRADGGFDCQTIIGSIGVNMIDNTIPNDTILDSGITVDTKKKRPNPLASDDEIITFDLNISLKTFISNIKSYIATQFIKSEVKNNRHKLGRDMFIYYSPNKFVGIAGNQNTIEQTKKVGGGLSAAWVRWGWFEDNILSKFTSMVSDKDIITEFRSIDTNVTTNEKSSVKIRSSKYLQTIDTKYYILPGKFSPVKEKTKVNIANESVILDGDNKVIVDLASIVNENFPSFGVDAPGFKESGDAVVVPTGTKSGPNGEKVITNSKGVSYYKQKTQGNDNSEFGYLRNMLVNIKVIENMFGITKGDDSKDNKTVESISISEAMENLFISLNTPINFWSFTLEQDATNDNRVRIIDEQTTGVNFQKPISSQVSEYDGTDVSKLGIFYFPVWRHDSIVKSQNVSANVPTAMQLATMYGANLDQLKYPNGAGITGEKDGLIVGGLNNDKQDERNKNLDFAFKQSMKIGNKNGFSNEDLTKEGSEDEVFEYLKKNIKSIKDYYSEKEKREAEINKPIKLSDIPYDASKPLPMLSNLSPEQRVDFLQNAEESEKQSLKELYGSKYILNYEDLNSGHFKLKEDFVKSISYLTTEHIDEKKGTADTNKSIIIPLEMELEIDGTGGIYPGNSYHSTYLPENYQNKTVFQMFDVNHNVNDGGWTTTISGKMRTTYNQVFDAVSKDNLLKDLIKNFQNKTKKQQEDAKIIEKSIIKPGVQSDGTFITTGQAMDMVFEQSQGIRGDTGKWVNSDGEEVLLFEGDDTTGLTWVPNG